MARKMSNGVATAIVDPAAKASEAPQDARIQLPELEISTIRCQIVGDSPLIVHRFSEKALKMMHDKQTGAATAGRQKKDPAQDFRDSMYRLPDGKHGFPALAFKCAMVEACTSLGKAITKVAARQAFHVCGDMVVLRLQQDPVMREDAVRLNGQTADLRYRAEYMPWSTEVTLTFNSRVLSQVQIVNLLNTAGFAVGVGEWRPEKNGQFGRFHVE